MHFPVYIPLGPVALHPHPVFEALAYAVGFRLYLRSRRANPETLEGDRRMWVALAAIGGAAIGCKVLAWFCDPAATLAHWNDLRYLMAGKTIVGGLIGGLAGVEWAKRRLGIRGSTGDAFVGALLAGTAIGRIGCFLSGPEDRTCGLPSASGLGFDFGDGVPRHPAPLYEIAWLGLLAVWIGRMRPRREGDRFRAFMAGYMLFRFFVEFLKPGVPLLGLTALQWAAAGTLFYYRRDLPRLIASNRAT